jgi:hypothetical protein
LDGFGYANDANEKPNPTDGIQTVVPPNKRQICFVKRSKRLAAQLDRIPKKFAAFASPTAQDYPR